MSKSNLRAQCHKLRMSINAEMKCFVDQCINNGMDSDRDRTDWTVAKNIVQAFLDNQKNRYPKQQKYQTQIKLNK